MSELVAVERLRVVAADGLTLAATCRGSRCNPAIVFVHGFNQSQLCWSRQMCSPLAERFRLVAYDLRGHGGSDKPADASRYRDARRWSDDLSAVMDAAGLERATLVAWSMGGRIAFDYLDHYGQERIAGLNLVGTGVSTRPEHRGTASADLLRMMCSRDLEENIDGTIRFLRLCFAERPAEPDFAAMVAYNMVIPPEVREMIIGMPNQPEAFVRTVATRTLVSFGERDALNSLAGARFAASILCDARLSLYPDAGHSPFYEAADRFNAELAAFVDGLGSVSRA